MASQLSRALDSVHSTYLHNTAFRLITNGIVIGAAHLAVFAIIRDYLGWYRLGAGGIPHNPFGWAIQSVMRILTPSDTRSTACYKKAITSDLERMSFLKSLPLREGNRPNVGIWVAPSRQLSETATEGMKVKVRSAIIDLAEANNDRLRPGTSDIEGGSPALFTLSKPTQRTAAKMRPEEVFHLHEPDGSMHAILSATDAKTVVEQGWGERHRMSGRFGFPLGYTMIYAPRSDEDLECIKTILRAAATYGVEGGTIN